MNLVSIRMITADIRQITAFYEKITSKRFTFYTDDFAELATEHCVLAIGSTKTLQAFGESDMAQPASNRSVIIEFMVADTEREYQRLEEFLKDRIVQMPTTMPWGNRSFLFRDPDGNLVNFFTPVSPEALKKFKAGK
ncbi:VOC family protein [Chryseobacterium sp. SSA4.19]|uniref:VOC family protein n=1 Tax=Chryseobacterium sp. SSA4.19 TaxID=2919915 RepID=UPI001F4E1610|nr:VOC family protein [Chryseobacterium sp. SSA4.19]MCJ8152781.1 VOC family protein [Chryseobacterium sp. SSA4.19]